MQVEHGVTEQVYNIDLVEWMVKLAADDLDDLGTIGKDMKPQGHAIQARIYAEDPNKDFQPCAGLLSEVSFPESDYLRIDHWLETGIEVPSLFDPMLAKIIVTAESRDTAIKQLDKALSETSLYGIETNIRYVQAILNTDIFKKGEIFTRYLNDFVTYPSSINVLSAGTLTTIQDYPGRTGYWDIGVPPSGPFDFYSFNLANRLLDNSPDAAGLEVTLNGPTLRFNQATEIVLSGAEMDVHLDDELVPFWQIIPVNAGQTLRMGKTVSAGARAYLCIKNGLNCPDYLGSKSTFTLGQFGGHAGRALRAGDVLHFHGNDTKTTNNVIPDDLKPNISNTWKSARISVADRSMSRAFSSGLPEMLRDMWIYSPLSSMRSGTPWDYPSGIIRLYRKAKTVLSFSPIVFLLPGPRHRWPGIIPDSFHTLMLPR